MTAQVYRYIEEPELTILIPCLNEAETIERCVEKAKLCLLRLGVHGEILVADNGSTDGSQDLAIAKGARVVHVPDRGYGAALRHGIHTARGRYVIMGDGDDSYDFSNLDPFLAKLRDGFDLVMGNRFKGGIAEDAMPLLHRYLGNPVLSFFGRLFFKIDLGDFHCGLRGFNRERICDLELYTTGMEFASEMVISAALKSYRICEVPTTLKKDGRSRPPHLRTWHDGWRHLSFLLMFSPRWLFVYPGLALILLGVVTAVILFPGPVSLANGVNLDVHTFLVAAIAVLIGVQTLTFGLIAQRFAIKYRLLPPGASGSRGLSFLTFDRGLLVAAALILLGLFGIGWSLFTWASVDFGPLRYPSVMRVLILSLTSIAIGVQLGFTVFLSGIMNIPNKRDRIRAAVENALLRSGHHRG
ncbi:glycosyltransferase family 2 protein [Bradyrhizobium sp. HKCCYLS1011]|uniref:glycosyltransferase family 2 protein n=1 Tax=Bradyrhizobium sp. HKCCYLS1011 TaxID=3420733 RepID=UPI003EB854DB